MNTISSVHEHELDKVLNLIGLQISEKQFTVLITEILRAYHIREAEKVSSILSESQQQNNWENLWPRFVNANPKVTALHSYVQYLMAQMDGGEFNSPVCNP